MKVKRKSLVTAFALLCVAQVGCGKNSKPNVEAAPSPTTIEAKQQQIAQLPPPELNAVQQAVKRVFRDCATVDTQRQPAFVAGDFNGDLSQDVAVIVKPAPGKLAEINEEFPAWLLRDPFKLSVPGTPAIKVEDNDVLLAIIHGYGDSGWHDVQATQTFLLRNAVGSNLAVHAGKAFISENSGRPLPRIHGDLIKQVVSGSSGYLYYAGPTYSWYDPKTFKGDAQVSSVHGRKAGMTR
ncbi:MAG TPA: hypothetical protein VN643_15280 [Pyrinomonadaceae bacterium]|nr:hypothetical protein [Pyrinomonadaceae bacterium]